ncbi:hypothetical protein ACOMHN_009370 [Nucella lapillus]
MGRGLGSVSMSLGLMSALLLVSVTSGQRSQPSPPVPDSGTRSPLLQRLSPLQGSGDQDEGHAVTLALRCPRENETVPYWIDSACRSFLACLNHSFSLQLCQAGDAYSHADRSCVARVQVNCTAQNEQFSTMVHGFLQAHFFSNLTPSPTPPLTPFAALVDNRVSGANFADPNADAHADSNAAAGGNSAGGGQGEGEGDNMMIDLDDLPSIIVDTSNSFNVTLDRETCVRVGSHLNDLQTSFNMALLMLTGCPQQRCDVTLFRLFC